MNLKKKFIALFVFVICVLPLVGFSCAAFSEKEIAVGKFYSDETKLLSISHRGDTANYPENSLKAVESAFSKGADFVSVSLDKTSDGVFYLSERESLGNICNAPYEKLSEISSDEIGSYRLFDVYGNETEFALTSLEELLDNTDSEDGIILDILSEDKDAVYDILSESKALYRVIIRTDDSCSRLAEWLEAKPEKVYSICVYGGNIIFSTASAYNNASAEEMPAVQYSSKNYFNVAYGDFFANRYLLSGKVRAVAATYSPDLCGQRADGGDGWNELINKGYSVIETNNIEAFTAYRDETVRLEKELAALTLKADEADKSVYSQVSLDNLEKAMAECEKLLSSSVFSLGEAQQAYSRLLFALEDMKISTGEVDTRGALNVTAGKLTATVLVGAALLCGQIYVYKMRKAKKEKQD